MVMGWKSLTERIAPSIASNRDIGNVVINAARPTEEALLPSFNHNETLNYALQAL